MASHTNDTKLVHVDAQWGGYHPNGGGFTYMTGGHDMLSAKFKSFTKQPTVDEPHAKARDENEPEMQPKPVVETVATKPDADNPKISMDVQVLPPPTGQMG